MKNNKPSTTFISLLFIITISACSTTKPSTLNTMVARMEIKEPIEGVCDNANIIAILPFHSSGQIEAQAPKTDEAITQELNSTVNFLVDKPNYEDKGMVNLIINCKGELVRCRIDNKTKSPELDSQIVAVFAKMKTWITGTVHNNSVDTSVLYSFTIKNGKIILN